MKKIIQVTVKVKQADPFREKTDLLTVGLFEGTGFSKSFLQLNQKLKGIGSALKRLDDFRGKSGTSVLLYPSESIAAQRVVLVGLGPRKKWSTQALRKAASMAASKAVELKASSLVMALHQALEGKDLKDGNMGQILCEGIHFGAYRWDEFSTSKEKRTEKLRVTIPDPSRKTVQILSEGLRAGNVIGQSQNFARTLANRPANVITPTAIAAEARKLAGTCPELRCIVFSEKQLLAKKMGGIMAVGQGSKNRPCMVVLEYRPAGKAKSKKSPVALVGKAITFDSGGISLKPGQGMDEMKFDKSGGIAVLGTMRAIAQIKPKIPVIGFIPAAENMPGGRSYRPGDIVTTFSGKTVEIQNTDAEGRMILCDAIAYADKLGCNPIVDIATLTGASVVALGTKRAGLMSTDPNLVEQFKKASEDCGERIWHLPCDEEFVEAMKSKIADLKNMGGKWGGASTAAAFLSQFVSKANWAHIDMAGVGVWGAEEKDAPGSIGFGVRLLTTFVLNQK